MDRDIYLSANNSLWTPSNEACIDLADLLAAQMDATPSPIHPSMGLDEPLPSPLAGGFSSLLQQAQEATPPQGATTESLHRPQPGAGTSRLNPDNQPPSAAQPGPPQPGPPQSCPSQPGSPQPGPPQPPAPAQQRPKKKKVRDEAARSRRKAARKKQSMQDMEECLAEKLEEMKFLEEENEKLRYHQSILDSVITTRSHQLGLVPQMDALPANSVAVTSGRDLTPSATTKKHSAAQHSTAQGPGSSGHESRVPRYPADTTLHSHSLNLFAAKPGTHIDPSYCQEITPKLFLEVYKDHIFKLSEHLRIFESQSLQQQSSSSSSVPAAASSSSCSYKDPQPSAESSSLAPDTLMQAPTPLSAWGQAIPMPPSPQSHPGVGNFLPTHPNPLTAWGQASAGTSLGSAAERGVINEACCVAHVFKFSSVHRPELVANQMARHLETGIEQVPDASHWRLLLQQLQFSSDQVSALLGASHLHHKLMRNVLSERTRLQTSLREYEEGATSANSFNLAYRLYVPTTAELLEKLLRNLRQERSLGWMLQGFLISHVCTVLQTAKVFAYSYPYMPDARPIISTLWSDMEANGTLPAEFARFRA